MDFDYNDADSKVNSSQKLSRLRFYIRKSLVLIIARISIQFLVLNFYTKIKHKLLISVLQLVDETVQQIETKALKYDQLNFLLYEAKQDMRQLSLASFDRITYLIARILRPLFSKISKYFLDINSQLLEIGLKQEKYETQFVHLKYSWRFLFKSKHLDCLINSNQNHINKCMKKLKTASFPSPYK